MAKAENLNTSGEQNNGADEESAAERLIRLLVDRSMYLIAAESCTAGLVAEIITRIPGASACFWGSFVCYTPRAKMQMLGVDEKLLFEYGAVSRETARAMALGALEKSGADIAVSVTGVAGPGGDGSGLAPGTVWIATALRSNKAGCRTAESAEAVEFYFSGDRNRVRQQAARKALEQITIRIEAFSKLQFLKNPD